MQQKTNRNQRSKFIKTFELTKPCTWNERNSLIRLSEMKNIVLAERKL